MPRRLAVPDRAQSLSFWLLTGFLMLLWIAGGASRADVTGQAVVRFGAWALLIAAILALPRPDLRAVRAPAVILGLVALLIGAQLVPLPPSIWMALPGRAVFADAATLAALEQPWRPLSISPDGTANALAALVVPALVLVLAAGLTREQHWHLALVILLLVVAGSLLGLVEASGARIRNPFINAQAGAVSGNFANRNHFALFLSLGCVLAPAWALRGERARWKMPVTVALIVLWALMILATGSRTGLFLGAIAILSGLVIARRHVMDHFRNLSRRAVIGLGLSVVAAVGGILWLSVNLNRAASIDRAAALGGEADLRAQIWPVATGMVQRYFPAGTGFGTFDPAFRISEPDALLNPLYVNQAHNDLLQIVLEGGIAGILLLGGGLAWFVWRAIRAWRVKEGGLLAKAGALMILLTLIASIPDYPARTPMIMALMAIAATWLASPEARARQASLR